MNFRELPLPTAGKFRPKVPTSNPLVREPLAQVPLGEKRGGEWQDVEQRKEKEEEEQQQQQGKKNDDNNNKNKR